MTGDDRLRAELEALERSAPADLPPRPPLLGQRRGLQLVLPAAATLGVGLLLGILGSQWLETLRPTGSARPTASDSATATPTPSSSAVVTALRWSVEPFVPDSGAVPGAVTEVDGRLLVTGRDQDGPAAWYSDDSGATWRRASVGGGGEEGRPMALESVAGNADRLLSLGWVTLSANDADRRSLLWTSTDGGLTWERIPDDGVPSRLHAVVAGGPGFVAVGNANPSNAGLPDVDPPHAAVWISSDGRAWERLPDEAAFRLARMSAIAERDGLLVAAGAAREGEDDVPAIWRSSDGRRWSRIELSSSSGAIEDIAAGADGFVAVGSSGRTGLLATAWRSADGLSWEPETIDPTGGSAATSVAVNPAGLVAIGTSTEFIDVPGFVWFAPVGDRAGQQDVGADLRDVVAVGDLFVAVGGCGPWADCYSDYLVIARPVIAGQPDASPELSGDLVGTLQGDRDLEVGCAWLIDASGKQWEVLWPEGYRITFPTGRDPVLIGPRGQIVAGAGDLIAVNGAPPSGLGSFCGVGELFEATQLVDVQR